MAVRNSAGRSVGCGGVPLRWGWGGGRLRVVRYGGCTRHSGRALRRYVDRHAIERVTVDGDWSPPTRPLSRPRHTRVAAAQASIIWPPNTNAESR